MPDRTKKEVLCVRQRTDDAAHALQARIFRGRCNDAVRSVCEPFDMPPSNAFLLESRVASKRSAAALNAGTSPKHLDGFNEARRRLPAHSGVVSGEALAGLLESRACGDYVSLAMLIAAKQVLALRWNDEFWIPLFQFDLQNFSVHKGIGDVLAELASVFDAWELAAWFSAPNAWLDGRCPADAIASDPEAVFKASRADRFVARG